jgi:hypothetical protein
MLPRETFELGIGDLLCKATTLKPGGGRRQLT